MAWSPQARRAAILARKRKARGRAKPVGRTRRAGKEIKRRYQAGHRGPGANYRRQRDRYNSQGYYKNRTGNKNSKKAGKVLKGYRKGAVVVSNVGSGAVLATTGVSYLRHKKSAKRGTVNMSRKQRVVKTATRRSSAIKKKTSRKR